MQSGFVVCLLLLAGCSEDKTVTVDNAPPPVGTPVVVALNSARPGVPALICAGTEGNGNTYEFQFDFGVGDPTDWTTTSCQSFQWAAEGRFEVRIRARRDGVESDWSDSWIMTVIDEVIQPPDIPGGDDDVLVGKQIRFCAQGASSSLGHSLEYRFRVDPSHDDDWSISTCKSRRWDSVGQFRVRAQARCVLHNGSFSDWSPSRGFSAFSAVATEIQDVRWAATPGASGTPINFFDTTPDTVPEGSWVTVVVEAIPPNYAATTCTDEVNYCTGFQAVLEGNNLNVPIQYVSPVLPSQPFDSNPLGLLDTIRFNAGSLDYILRPAAVDEFGPDAAPPALPLVGNLKPTLDDSYIENFDGTIVRNAEDLLWNWWSPENTDTLDAAKMERKKRFSFVIRAIGHDDPRDIGSAIDAWRYLFIAADNPALFWPFARANAWVPSLQQNALSDTVVWEVTYPEADINGNTVFANLPEWINRSWDFAVTGRDSPVSGRFDQVLLIDGVEHAIESHAVADYGRRTQTGFQRFSIRLDR